MGARKKLDCAFLISCRCLEKWFGRGYQISWLLFWENSIKIKKKKIRRKTGFSWGFCAEQPGWEQVSGHLDCPKCWCCSISGMCKWHSSARASSQWVLSLSPQLLLWNTHGDTEHSWTWLEKPPCKPTFLRYPYIYISSRCIYLI